MERYGEEESGWEMGLVYSVVVVGVTAWWVWAYRKKSFSFLATAMYFPALFALLFEGYHGGVEGIIQFLSESLSININVIVWSIGGVLIQYFSVYSIVVLNYQLGWITRGKEKKEGVHEHNKVKMMGLMRASGEELGWRCYLLPLLLRSFSPAISFTISGIVWGVYHIPIMILLSILLKPKRKITTIGIQCVGVALQGFVYGAVAIQSNYSLWPPALMHFTWNQINPKLLGSIYTQSQGRWEGEQWKINGEGLAGSLFSLLLIPPLLYFYS